MKKILTTFVFVLLAAFPLLADQTKSATWFDSSEHGFTAHSDPAYAEIIYASSGTEVYVYLNDMNTEWYLESASGSYNYFNFSAYALVTLYTPGTFLTLRARDLATGVYYYVGVTVQ